MRIELPPEESQSVSQAETEASEEVEQAASELGSGSFAIIYRLNPRTAQYAYLDRMPGGDINGTLLAERYGGGSYKVQFRGPKAGKRNVILETKTFEVDSSIPPKTPYVDLKPRMGTGAAAAAEADGSDVTMDKIMQAGVLRLFSAYENVLDRREGADGGEDKGDKLMQMMIAMMSSNTQMMMTMMQSQSQAQAQTMTALISMMTANKPELQEQVALIRALQPSDKTSLKDMLEGFQMLREISGDAPPPLEGWPGVVREFAPAVVGALNHAVQADNNRPASSPQPPAVSTPSLPRPESNNPPTSMEPHMLWKFAVRQHLPYLLKQAAAGKDPELYAEVLADQVPPQYLGALRVAVSEDTFVTDTLAAFPDTHPYRDWFTALLSTIKDLILEPDESDVLSDEGDRKEAPAEG